MINSFTQCGMDCDWRAEPLIDRGSCAPFEQVYAQIEALILLPATLSVTDWTDGTAWEAVIANNVAGRGRILAGTGELEDPEELLVTYPYGMEAVASMRYELAFTVPNMSDSYYDFLLHLQCCRPLSFRMWYITASHHLYGGPSGIACARIGVHFPVTGEADEPMTGVLRLVWDAQCAPRRTTLDNVEDLLGTSIANAFGPFPAPPAAAAIAFGPKQTP